LRLLAERIGRTQVKAAMLNQAGRAMVDQA
jgi:hypothetical protein